MRSKDAKENSGHFIFEIASSIKGRGLILAPVMPVESDLPKSAQILLIRPDGRKLETEATFEVSHFRFSNPEEYAKRNSFARVIILKDLTKSDVPVGTEIWIR